MFSKKVKCPNCEAKNSKERMTCETCGNSLTSNQVERPVTEVQRKGEYDKAIADYTKAIELDPNDADAYYNRGLNRTC